MKKNNYGLPTPEQTQKWYNIIVWVFLPIYAVVYFFYALAKPSKK